MYTFQERILNMAMSMWSLYESGIMAVCYFLLGNYCDKYLSNYDNIYLNK